MPAYTEYLDFLRQQVRVAMISGETENAPALKAQRAAESLAEHEHISIDEATERLFSQLKTISKPRLANMVQSTLVDRDGELNLTPEEQQRYPELALREEVDQILNNLLGKVPSPTMKSEEISFGNTLRL